MTTRTRQISGCAVALAALLLLGTSCEEDAVAPDPTPTAPDLFFPLEVGEAWSYDRARTVQFLALDGSGEVQPPLEFRGGGEREMLTTEDIDSLSYVVERQWLFAEGGVDTVETWRRYRQDDTGLYRAAVPVSEPPAPALLAVVERVLLAYPLEIGNEWAETAGGIMRRVESYDTLATAAGRLSGYRIRITAPTDGPDDLIYEWYGRDGLLRTTAHTEFLAMDPGSGETVRVVSDEIMDLSARRED